MFPPAVNQMLPKVGNEATRDGDLNPEMEYGSEEGSDDGGEENWT